MAMDVLTANDVAGAYPASYYTATSKQLAPFPELKGEVVADVAVVGGGFTGLSTALHLAERGYDVVLLDAQRVGWGASGRNGGQLGSGQRVEQDALEKKWWGATMLTCFGNLRNNPKILLKALLRNTKLIAI